MTLEHEESTAWRQEGFAKAWTEQDGMAELLRLPRHLVAAIAAHARPPRKILDIGSGPGAFLTILLDAFPEASGTWLDTASEMAEIARPGLARFGDRVDYVIGDMSNLAAAGLADAYDLIVSSRAVHHLPPEELPAFYRSTRQLLNPGGWVANLDHTHSASAAWQARYSAIRPIFVKPGSSQLSHPHPYRLGTEQEHLAAMHTAGLVSIEIPWKAFYTCLLMAQAPSESAAG